MTVIFGSARMDENGKITGGEAGDQTGREVSTQNYYMHKKGWYCLRPKIADVANILAISMLQACNNDNIGYDQNNRAGVIACVRKYGTMEKISEKTESDCSSLVRACCIQAGFDPGNFNTAGEVDALESTGRFEKKFDVKSSDELYDGDVLVTKTKGHTVIVVNGKDRISTSSGATLASAQNKLKQALKLIPGTATLADAQAELKAALKITGSSNAVNNSPSGAATTQTISLHKYIVGNTYTLQVDALRVRTGPGTSYPVKELSQLSANAREHAYSNGTLKKGTRVTCKAVRNVGNDIWIQTPSGWMAAYYSGMTYIS